jgi:hypothetical protein
MKDLNPFIIEQSIRVLARKKDIDIMVMPKMLEDRIIENPETGRLGSKFVVDVGNRVNIYMTPELRVIYMRLSEISHKILRYFEGIVQPGDDLIKLNMNKFMDEALIKSRTTVYKGIEELCRYGFITPHHKNTYYWINPFRFFNGSRIKKYPNNLKIIN